MPLEKDHFGTTADGLAVERYTLKNARGAMVRVMTYGATVTELHMPDRHGTIDDVVLGFDTLAQYEQRGPYFGATVGRVAFRIANGEFTLDGKHYQLPRNDGTHHLHGGPRGFSHVVWQAEPLSRGESPSIRFSHRSPDGDQGYPGNLDVAVTYTLTEENDLQIDMVAAADQPTLLNLTHHSYFNLQGIGSGDVLGHVLQLNADRWIVGMEPDAPTGDIVPVQGTPYDFLQPTPIGDRIAQTGGEAPGYDLCYLLNQPTGNLMLAATVDEPTAGRRLQVLTTEPSIVFYTANYLDGTLRGKRGQVYGKQAGFCLETGRPPDAIHHPGFPSTVLRPGETYRHQCVYRFTTTH
jgi:aldose 1-epimerase